MSSQSWSRLGRHASCFSNLQADGQWLQKVTAAWQQGKLSNLDYLLFCNLAAGRSFNDLTQWPVFPWILADCTSHSVDLSNPSMYRRVHRRRTILAHVCQQETLMHRACSCGRSASLPRIIASPEQVPEGHSRAVMFCYHAGICPSLWEP